MLPRGLAVGLLALGCSRPAPTFHRDVEPITRARCAVCHDGSGLAPLPLRDFQEVVSAKASVLRAVQERTMPPWSAVRGCTPYEGDGSLTDEQIDTVVSWVGSGAPEGESAEGPPLPPLSTGLTRVDLTVPMAAPFSPGGGGSSYRCFVLDWPLATASHITGFRARPGNAALVHHAIAFVAPPELVQDFRALDAADEGQGYACAAGPGIIDRRVPWVGAWEPGSQGDVYPDGTGFAVHPGSALVIQMHYDTSSNPFGSDLTSFELQLEQRVEKEAWVMTWADPSWITTDTGMLIRAGDSHAKHDFFEDPTPLHSDGQPLWVRGVSLHMHRLGRGGGLRIERPDGSSTCLLDIPRWDFDWQRSYRLARPALISPKDKLGISCEWDNSAENQPRINGVPQPPKDRTWGPSTSDEMCLGALFVTR